MTIQLLSVNKEKEYGKYISENSKSPINRTLAWRNIICKAYQYKPFYLISQKNEYTSIKKTV